MTKACLKCGKTFDENTVEDPANKCPSCQECWKEWTTHAIMVMNEMRLDMSLPEHRKMLRKYEEFSLVWKSKKVNFRKILIKNQMHRKNSLRQLLSSMLDITLKQGCRCFEEIRNINLIGIGDTNHIK